MSLTCRCQCGTRLRIREYHPGAQVRCPACGAVSTLPGIPPGTVPATGGGCGWWIGAAALSALVVVGGLALLAFVLLLSRQPVPDAGNQQAQAKKPPAPAAAQARSAGDGLLQPGDGAATGERFALLVGVNYYEHPKLPALRFAEADVTELAEVLQTAGYRVTLLTGAEGDRDPSRRPTRANIEKRLAELLGGCRKGDTVVVGLSGHGLQFEGQPDAYFCPRDARPLPGRTETLVSLGTIYRELESSFAAVKVLLVDACRDDPTAVRGARGVDADRAPRPPRGVAALFSCSAAERAYEHETLGHGVFFHCVLEGLRGQAKNGRGEVTFGSLAEYVQGEVAREVPSLIGGGAKQSPNLKADLSGPSPVLVRLEGAPGPRPEAKTVEQNPEPGGRPDETKDAGRAGVEKAETKPEAGNRGNSNNNNIKININNSPKITINNGSTSNSNK